MFTALNEFVVSERPMASERTDPFSHTPIAKWLRNGKVRRAAQDAAKTNRTKYVEDGDVLYKVRTR
jgi:hypothetical protein